MFLGLQPITTDLYLPALPALTLELKASLAAAQQTMAALLLAFGVAQLGWGPLADRLGRKPVLLMGLALNAAASLGGALTPSIEALIVWRMLQGLGLAAVVVCARAVVRDLYEPHEGGRIMALALSGLGFIALACPLAGGALAASFGWRASLASVAALATALALFVVWSWPETLLQRNPRATQLAPMLATWRRIASNARFRAWALLVASTYGGLFVLLAGSSFVFINELGASPLGYGLALATGSLAYIVGTVMCRRWIAHHGLAGTVRRASWFTLSAVLGLVACAFVAKPSVWLVMVPIWLYMLGHGCHQPCGQTGAVGPFPREAGAASALAGFVLALLAFGTGLWLGWALKFGAPALLLSMALFGATTCGLARTLVGRAEAAPAIAAG